MRKRMSENECQKECQIICQCQKICQKECQKIPWRPHRAAPETKDFLTTKTRVANHMVFSSTASNVPTSIIPTMTLAVKGPRRLSLSSDTAAQSLILNTCAQNSNRHSPSPNKQTHWWNGLAQKWVWSSPNLAQLKHWKKRVSPNLAQVQSAEQKC